MVSDLISQNLFDRDKPVAVIRERSITASDFETVRGTKDYTHPACIICGFDRCIVATRNGSKETFPLCPNCRTLYDSLSLTPAEVDKLHKNAQSYYLLHAKRRSQMLRKLIYEDIIARGKTEAVAKEWGAVAEDFERVCGCKCAEDPEEYGKKYARADITLYLVHLRKRGLAQSTIKKNLKAIRLLSQIQGWDFPKLSMKPISADDVRRTILTRDQVTSMIQMGKKLLHPTDLAYVSLVTTYGLRRVELARLEECDFNPPGCLSQGGVCDTITVHTAKGGAKTTHIIPPEIAPYISAFRPYQADTLTHHFHRIMIQVGLKATGGFGWHSIRRSLATELILLDASALNVLRFMRWADASARGEFGMLAIYVKRDQARIDEAIFKIHPFLPFWREA